MKVGLFDSVLTMCPTLSRIEKEVLQTRFGSRVVSYAETAQRLGLTADTVCEIELGALQKLRLSSVETRTSAVGGWDEV